MLLPCVFYGRVLLDFPSGVMIQETELFQNQNVFLGCWAGSLRLDKGGAMGNSLGVYVTTRKGN